MKREPEQLDYFFVIDHGGYQGAEVHSRGEGDKVLAAVARIAILDYSGEALQRGRFSMLLDAELLTAIVDTSVSYEAPRVSNPLDPKRLYANPVELFSLMNQMRHMRYDSIEDLLELRQKHFETALNQVRDGIRSPESYLEELTKYKQDNKLLYHNGLNWFDAEGRAVGHGPDETVHESADPRLLLRRVTRSESKDYIDTESRSQLFEALPEGAKAYKVKTVPFRKSKQGYIHEKRPFIGGKMLNHETYGYVEKDSEEFVPVMSVVSEQHPARKKK